MSAPVFIGDELTGAGFRLAGLRVRGLSVDTVEADFRRALEEAPFVVLTARAAAGLPAVVVDAAVRAASPPVAIVPEAAGGPALPDMGRAVRRALGVES